MSDTLNLYVTWFNRYLRLRLQEKFADHSDPVLNPHKYVCNAVYRALQKFLGLSVEPKLKFQKFCWIDKVVEECLHRDVSELNQLRVQSRDSSKRSRYNWWRLHQMIVLHHVFLHHVLLPSGTLLMWLGRCCSFILVPDIYMRRFGCMLVSIISCRLVKTHILMWYDK